MTRNCCFFAPILHSCTQDCFFLLPVTASRAVGRAKRIEIASALTWTRLPESSLIWKAAVWLRHPRIYHYSVQIAVFAVACVSKFTPFTWVSKACRKSPQCVRSGTDFHVLAAHMGIFNQDIRFRRSSQSGG